LHVALFAVRINWSEDSTDTIVQKIRAADGFPGVQDTLLDLPVYLYGAVHEDALTGKPKEVMGCQRRLVRRL
jgi:putative two-component system hydrogenase maturation factor HypX/HoxX